MFLPGIAVKLFRDGYSSANIHAMHSIKGISTANFFQHNFTNHLPIPENFFAFNLAASKFAQGSNYALNLGLKDMAYYDQTGATHTGSIGLPFRLEFEP